MKTSETTTTFAGVDVRTKMNQPSWTAAPTVSSVVADSVGARTVRL